MGSVKKRVLQPKVTVASVKRQWEEKYAELSERYDSLCQAHVDLASRADWHRNNEESVRQELEEAQRITIESLANSLRQEGVIAYLEKKLATSVRMMKDIDERSDD